jgi:NTP pyrophosphatase (non-canonical NTP hydrolase)
METGGGGVSIETLEKQVIEWANERDLYRQSTPRSRWDKFIEETDELMEAYFDIHDDPTAELEDVRLETGDVLVTLINLLHPLGLDLGTCLSAAYQKIKDRKGKMIDGTFVKDVEQ